LVREYVAVGQTLFGDSGPNTLYGGTGDDSLSGLSGNDGDRVLAVANGVVSGLGTSTVVLADNSTLIAFNGHAWASGDFLS
jgi:Ca2+-binding RTX toxin-like protein